MNDQTHSPAYAELGPTPRLTSTGKESNSKNGKIVRLIGELGMRFRPTAQADLEAHAAMLALLIRDLATVNADALERAIAEHIRCSRFMPKVAELLEIIARQKGKSNHADLDFLVANGNAKCPRDDLEWHHWNGEMRLREKQK